MFARDKRAKIAKLLLSPRRRFWFVNMNCRRVAVPHKRPFRASLAEWKSNFSCSNSCADAEGAPCPQGGSGGWLPRCAASSFLFLPARLICIQMRLLLLKMGKLAFTRCPLTLARSSTQRPKLHNLPQSGFFCRYVSMMSQELRRRVVDIRLQV